MLKRIEKPVIQNVIYILLPCFWLHQFANIELGWFCGGTFVLQGLLVPVYHCYFIEDFLLTYSCINKLSLWVILFISTILKELLGTAYIFLYFWFELTLWNRLTTVPGNTFYWQWPVQVHVEPVWGWRSQFQEGICNFLGYPHLANYSGICCIEMMGLNNMDFSVGFTGGLELTLCISVLLNRKNHHWVSEYNFSITRKYM